VTFYSLSRRREFPSENRFFDVSCLVIRIRMKLGDCGGLVEFASGADVNSASKRKLYISVELEDRSE